jgi:hypothetical protein
MKFKGTQLAAYSNILAAAMDNCLTNEDYEVGYNEMSGNVWMWFEDLDITIAAPDYRPSQVSFFVVDIDNGHEYEFDTYEEAVEYRDELERQRD